MRSGSASASASGRGGFPIPMRGNESLAAAWQDTETLAFPIPMRGNERLGGRMPRAAAAVSDPHEG